ncbi:MAG: hypothetical protein AB7G76_03595 [Steroidobacteraceae bacterium]
MAGAILPGLAWSQSAPCPPPTMGISGGSTANTACNASSAAADWAARSTGAGVVWATDFSESPGAIEKFILRSNGTPASWTSLDTSEGIQGRGAMRQYCGAGARNGHKWPRPFSPFPADSKFSLSADPGFTKGIGGNTGGVQWPYSGERPDATDYLKWRYGLYGHSAYWNTTREYSQTTPWEWVQKSGGATRDFYIQVRTKITASLFNINNLIANNHRGKHVYIDLCGGGAGELVSFSPAEHTSGNYVSHRARFYTYFNGFDLEEMIQQQPAPLVQRGGAWDASCRSDNRASGQCWDMPENEWFTLLFHVIPGRHNASMGAPQYNPWLGYATATARDTGVEVWGHKRGDSGYSLIHRRVETSPGANNGYAWYYNATTESNYNSTKGPCGFNEFEINAYMGSRNDPSEMEWTRWFDQIIFSHEFIPAPNDGLG